VESLSINNNCKSAILELWTPPENNIQDTIRKEEVWARGSIEYLKTLFK
jgi:hypothetical protein